MMTEAIVRRRVREALMLHVLRNSGARIWVADRLVAIAGLLNPAKPWRNNGRGQYLGTDGEMHDDNSEVGGAVMEQRMIPRDG